MIRRFVLAMMVVLMPLPAMAAELLMFDARGCYWCDRWKSEVGGYYHGTREGRTAPLRRVSLDRRLPPDLSWIRGVRASPTFVLIHRGREIGRIVGYTDERQFWARMDGMMRGLAQHR